MKFNLIAIFAAIFIILGAIIYSGSEKNQVEFDSGDSVLIVDGRQIIEIDAKGGYWPKEIDAKSEIPTILRFNTSNTFDCSSALVIPSINYSKNLPPNGSTEVDLEPQKSGTKLRGLCSMGMYGFIINFN